MARFWEALARNPPVVANERFFDGVVREVVRLVLEEPMRWWRDGALQHDGRIQVCERVRGGRIREIVGGNVDRLHARDRACLGRSDALLQVAHLGGQRRLVTHCRRCAAE